MRHLKNFTKLIPSGLNKNEFSNGKNKMLNVLRGRIKKLEKLYYENGRFLKIVTTEILQQNNHIHFCWCCY